MPFNENEVHGSINLAQEGGTYRTAYFKLLKIADINNISNVILGCSYQNFSHTQDKILNENLEQVYRIYPLVNFKTLVLNSPNKLQLLKVLTREILTPNMPILCRYLTNKNFMSIASFDSNKIYKSRKILKLEFERINSGRGNYLRKMKTKKFQDRIVTKLKYNFFDNDSTQYLSSLSINYLDKMALFCRKNGINLYLVKTPLVPNYKNNIPEYYKRSYNEIINRLVENDNVTFVDFCDLYDDDLSMFRDEEHVLPYCGILLSQRIDSILNI